MPQQYVSKEQLTAWVTSLALTNRVLAPVRSGNELVFQHVNDGANMELGNGLPINPVKEALFPQTQVLLKYRTHPNLQIMPEHNSAIPTVLFGVKACDVAGIARLDQVFTTGSNPDPSYSVQRAHVVLVALACRKAQPTCFCTSFGINPTTADGADILLFPLDDGFTLEVRTERGAALLVALPSDLPRASTTQVEAQATASGEALSSFTLQIPVANLADNLQKQFDSPMWAEVAQKCLSCGVCTYMCPTCHCFDIQDETRGNAGKRYKCWDSCMFSDFTRMAGGHNPRPTKRERVRQRFLHKLCYFPQNNGEYGCVGCGRCLRKCPVGMDITDIVARAQAESLVTTQVG